MIKSSVTQEIRSGIGDWNLFDHGCLISGNDIIPSAQEVFIHLGRNSYHLMRLLAQVSPPPNAVRMTKSPF
jgi:hypothetical protein